MRDSERDHNTVVEVLSAFIREHARKEDAVVNGAEGEGGGDGGGRRERLVGDLQAAMEVLGRRPDRQELEDEGGLERVNLTKVDLRGVELYCHTLKHVDMRDARLDGAQFYMVDFFGAQLQDSCFNGADFCWADLSVCDLSGSDLRNTRLHGAKIKHSTLRRVDFSGADMSEVLLENSDLTEANLEAVNFLSIDQVLMARIFRSTKLPVEMCQDARVEARIEECEAERLAWLESRRQAQP
ncbi:pentapeptide repeat-containing protein [Streptomyces tuirus]|uniref:Pentapeptide repeat-containing protein n=1 Tax=Streptomyces tuirus TaxID=68278 RepID=A0A941FC62_9ACTN|nr:pentapeptide repeat-containing protein [Streptomyces tuirus]